MPARKVTKQAGRMNPIAVAKRTKKKTLTRTGARSTFEPGAKMTPEARKKFRRQ